MPDKSIKRFGDTIQIHELVPGNYYLIFSKEKRSPILRLNGRFKYLGKSKTERLFIEQSGKASFFMDDRYETKDYTIYYVMPPTVEQQKFKDMEEILKAIYLRGSNSFVNSDSNSFVNSNSNSSVNNSPGDRRRKTLRKKHTRGTRKSIGSPN